MKKVKRLWRKLTQRPVWIYTTNQKTQGSVSKWEEYTRPGYYFTTWVYRPEWGRWRKIGVFPIEIRDDSGKLLALRVTEELLFGTGEDDPSPQSFFLDDPELHPGSPPHDFLRPRA